MPSSTDLKSFSDGKYLDQSFCDRYLMPKTQESHIAFLFPETQICFSCFPTKCHAQNWNLGPCALFFRILWNLAHCETAWDLFPSLPCNPHSVHMWGKGGRIGGKRRQLETKQWVIKERPGSKTGRKGWKGSDTQHWLTHSVQPALFFCTHTLQKLSLTDSPWIKGCEPWLSTYFLLTHSSSGSQQEARRTRHPRKVSPSSLPPAAAGAII